MAKRPSRKQEQSARKARLEALRREQARKRRRQNLLVIGGALLVGVLVIVGVAFAISRRSPSIDRAASVSPPKPTGAPVTAPAAKVDTGRTSPIKGVQFFTGLSRQHVPGPVTYKQVPPTGGEHNPVWLNCGIYNDAVPSANAVHDLEHGAIWITYQPTLDAAGKGALIKLLDSYGKPPKYVTLSPYPGLPSKVVASGWGVQLKLDSATDPRLKKFIDTYRQGPQTPEKGSACTGGTGSPRGDVQASPTPTGATTP